MGNSAVTAAGVAIDGWGYVHVTDLKNCHAEKFLATCPIDGEYVSAESALLCRLKSEV